MQSQTALKENDPRSQRDYGAPALNRASRHIQPRSAFEKSTKPTHEYSNEFEIVTEYVMEQRLKAQSTIKPLGEKAQDFIKSAAQLTGAVLGFDPADNDNRTPEQKKADEQKAKNNKQTPDNHPYEWVMVERQKKVPKNKGATNERLVHNIARPAPPAFQMAA